MSQNNRAVPTVTYLELLDKVNEDNLQSFRVEAAKFYPKHIQNIQSNAEYLAKIKQRIIPNMGATRSILDGTHITVWSSTFKHDKKLTPKEIEGVLAHELGHHAAYDSFKGLFSKGLYWTTVILGLSSLRLAGVALVGGVHIVSNYFGKSVEINADLYSADKVGPQGMRISYCSKMKSIKDNFTLEEKAEKENQNVFIKAKGYYQEWSKKHPKADQKIAIFQQHANEQAAPAAPAISTPALTV